jgi:hypothetical protein
MSGSTTDIPRPKTKAFGVLLAGLVAVVSMVVVTVTGGPKKADSSPAPARAAIMPQIADSKSEAEILFRGKSFACLKRNVWAYQGGVIDRIDVKEGQTVRENQILGSFTLDREAMNMVHNRLYPATLLNLKGTINARKTNIEKIREAGLPIKRLQLERAEKELKVTRDLADKKMSNESSVRDKERDLETIKKQILELKQTLEESETDLKKLREDLDFQEHNHKRELGDLSWQTKRPYPDPDQPLEKAFLTAPIGGKVLWISPLAREKHEFKGGFHIMTVAPMDSVLVRCKVHELDLVKLKAGDSGTVSFDAIPSSEYRCTISRIPLESRNPSLEAPADYDIECLIENTDGKIKEGLSCNVKVSVSLGGH